MDDPEEKKSRDDGIGRRSQGIPTLSTGMLVQYSKKTLGKSGISHSSAAVIMTSDARRCRVPSPACRGRLFHIKSVLI